MNFVKHLPERVEVPRSLATLRQEITANDLNSFGDASGQGNSAAVYAVIEQGKDQSQELIVSESRLAKKGLTIPRARVDSRPHGSKSS